jgi:hypothetical protein
MPKREPPLFSELTEEVARAGAELREMALLRWQLAWLELNASIATVKRLAIALAMVVVALLTALPLLAVWAAQTLAVWPGGLDARHWLLIFAVVLLAAGGLGGWMAWRRFRHQFTGMEETIEELREDSVWLREWLGLKEDGARDEG